MSETTTNEKASEAPREDSNNAHQGLELQDGATGAAFELVDLVEEQRRIAADPSRDLQRRLEAFQDILDSQVGDTNLVRARNVEREVSLRQIFLKFEGGNPTGTQKDRIAFAQAMDALRRGFDTMTVATCGNYGVAVALACSLAGLRCVIHIPETYHTRRVKEMTELGAEILRAGSDYENCVQISRQNAVHQEHYDANPGGANTALQLRVYGEIAYEIYDELRDAPAVVAAPVSNGTTLAGIFQGFLSLYRRGKTSHMPRMVAGSSHGKNPIVSSFLAGSPRCLDLEPRRIKETSINEPLINWHSSEGDEALEAIRQTRGWAGNASDREMSSFSRLLREREGLHVLPASAAGLIAVIDRHRQKELVNDRYVVILTGRRA